MLLRRTSLLLFSLSHRNQLLPFSPLLKPRIQIEDSRFIHLTTILAKGKRSKKFNSESSYPQSSTLKQLTKSTNTKNGPSQAKSTNPFDSIDARVIEPDPGIFGSVGEELSGKKLDKQIMLAKLTAFYQDYTVREIAKTNYIDDKLFTKAFVSFRRYCFKSKSLPPELHIKFCDIIGNHGHITDLFPFFLSHAREAFPHLECYEELRKISDLGLPYNWYPEARGKIRKVYFHSGPTNSGKTYSAMKRFLESKSGIYCGPLKLLAVEIFNRSNENNTPCDLVTGEERKLANPDGVTKSNHVSCTVEMAQIHEPVEVVVIDEIQMIRDPQRGWAWTRALLGLPADEVHLCGEEAAIDIIKRILEPTGDILEVINYKRLTPLVIEEEPLKDLKNIRDGDCIVCFNKDSIYSISMELEALNKQVAVVYGTLPPGAKIAQCKKFNDAECNVMVATDAIGMGLNLSIGRIIFFSLMKTTADEKGQRWQEYISTSQCLQIAGRAGRFKTAHEIGYVTTYKPEDLRQLREIMSRPVQPIERGGLHPTAEQIELFAFHLPHLSLSNLIDLFIDLCEFDSSAYFICDLESFKLLANTIEHINVPLKARFIFCCAPINIKFPFSIAMFTKFVRQFSIGEPITVDWLKRAISWPKTAPKGLEELSHLEQVHDALELYLWLSYRFVDIFPEAEGVRDLQKELDAVIFKGVSDIVKLIKAIKTKQRKKAEKQVNSN